MSLAFGTTQINRNAENAVRLPGKSSIQTNIGLKRPALGEIGNKLDKFAVPSLRHGIKKTQTLKTSTYAKEKSQAYVKEKSKPDGNQVKLNVSSSSLLSINLNQETENQSAPIQSFSAGLFDEIEDVDKDDLGNPLLVATYAPDIYKYLLELEEACPVRSNFLENQDITPKMRATLVDWLVDVQEQYKLLQETLFLTVSITDRYLQGAPTNRKFLQLVGVAALFIAGKYEEIYSLDVGELVFVTDNAYSKREVLQMEKKILQVLKFDLGKPVSLHFLRRFSKVSKVLPLHHSFAKFFLEWALVDYELCHVRPSRLAAAALFIAKCIYGHADKKSSEIWDRTLEYYSGVPLAEVTTTAVKIAKMLIKSQSSKYQAIGRKYSSPKLMKVSQRPEMCSEELKKLASGILP